MCVVSGRGVRREIRVLVVRQANDGLLVVVCAYTHSHAQASLGVDVTCADVVVGIIYRRVISVAAASLVLALILLSPSCRDVLLHVGE